MLRLVSYNIKSGLHHPGGLDAVAATVRALDPDVLALQEVDRGTQRAGGADQAAELARSADLPHAAFGAATPWPGGGEYGVALASRFQLEQVAVMPLWTPDDPAVPQSLREPRTLLSATIRAEGRAVRVFVAHLGLSDEQRRIQVREIAAAVRQATVHADPVLMGDFNDAPGTPALQPLAALLADAHAGLSGAARGTFPTMAAASDPRDAAQGAAQSASNGAAQDAAQGGAHRTDAAGDDGRIAIDYVMVPPAWTVRDAFVYHDEGAPHASDHYALVADVQPG